MEKTDCWQKETLTKKRKKPSKFYFARGRFFSHAMALLQTRNFINNENNCNVKRAKKYLLFISKHIHFLKYCAIGLQCVLLNRIIQFGRTLSDLNSIQHAKTILLVVDKFYWGACLLMWVSYDMVITCKSTVEYHIIRCIFSVFMFCNVKCCSCAQHLLDLFLLVQVFSCFLHWIKIYSTRNQKALFVAILIVISQWTYLPLYGQPLRSWGGPW